LHDTLIITFFYPLRYVPLIFLHLFLLIIPRPPTSTLFPYTTLFRSTRQSSATAGGRRQRRVLPSRQRSAGSVGRARPPEPADRRSEEHTSELQSRGHLVCRLLLEKKKKKKKKKEKHKKKKKININ